MCCFVLRKKVSKCTLLKWFCFPKKIKLCVGGRKILKCWLFLMKIWSVLKDLKQRPAALCWLVPQKACVFVEISKRVHASGSGLLKKRTQLPNWFTDLKKYLVERLVMSLKYHCKVIFSCPHFFLSIYTVKKGLWHFICLSQQLQICACLSASLNPNRRHYGSTDLWRELVRYLLLLLYSDTSGQFA